MFYVPSVDHDCLACRVDGVAADFADILGHVVEELEAVSMSLSHSEA